MEFKELVCFSHSAVLHRCNCLKNGSYIQTISPEIQVNIRANQTLTFPKPTLCSTANIRILDIRPKVARLARQGDIQYVSSALSQCFTCLGRAQLTVVVGALRNAALLQLQGRFHSSSSKVTAAAKNSLRAKAAAAQPPKHLQHGIASRG